MRGKQQEQQSGTPFEQGEAAAQAGHSQRANPYRAGTIQHQRWVSGWNWAQMRMKKKAA